MIILPIYLPGSHMHKFPPLPCISFCFRESYSLLEKLDAQECPAVLDEEFSNPQAWAALSLRGIGVASAIDLRAPARHCLP